VSDSAQASRPELIRSIVHRPAGEEVVALPVEGRLASFDRATAWLNSDPLTPAGLHGRVVVVDFWTYTCVNWLRTLPYLRAWAAKYQDDGLTVIGVHTPEFDFEGDIENVTAQARALGVEYPIAVDTDTRFGPRSRTTTGRRSTSPTTKAGSDSITSVRASTR
jgi:thiol-disulfide isomerase/thioredoxin